MVIFSAWQIEVDASRVSSSKWQDDDNLVGICPRLESTSHAQKIVDSTSVMDGAL